MLCKLLLNTEVVNTGVCVFCTYLRILTDCFDRVFILVPSQLFIRSHANRGRNASVLMNCECFTGVCTWEMTSGVRVKARGQESGAD
jgi:hypothetical protein